MTTFQILVDKEVVAELDSKEEAILQAQHTRPNPRWVEVRSSDGFQVFAEHEFTHDDHIQSAKKLLRLLEDSDSAMPAEHVLDHIRRTVSVCQTVILTLPGRYTYAGIEVSRYQLIARPTELGCNKHFFVITEGYAEGYSAELYESARDAMNALQERIGTDSIPLSALF